MRPIPAHHVLVGNKICLSPDMAPVRIEETQVRNKRVYLYYHRPYPPGVWEGMEPLGMLCRVWTEMDPMATVWLVTDDH